MTNATSGTHLVNYQNYGPYLEFIENGHQVINVNREINEKSWQLHYDSILNIMKDGIETDFIHDNFITIRFSNPITVDLSVADYCFNLIMWYMLIRTDTKIEPKHLFFEDEFKKNSIKNYIDKFCITPNRKKFSNKELNNIIDDTMHLFQGTDNFSFYLANTMNLEDTIEMMNSSKEFERLLHLDLSSVPIEDTKSVGMKYTARMIEIMKNDSKNILGYDHCLADAWRASEGVNPKQFKEFAINIGSKPDGSGGVFPEIINKSFLNGGVADPMDYFIESSTGRTAQILSKMNVGSSGHFARLLGLNNSDSFLHNDPDYCCDSVNFIKAFVMDHNFLNKINNRYYRMNPHGVEFLVDSNKDTHLIGQTVYLRSPMTCASASRGQGICYRCYGDLAYTVKDINIGRIASEILSSVLTQILLSAKHLLETVIEKLNWCDKFMEYFDISGNIITLIAEMDYKDLKLLIDPEGIELEDDDDDYPEEDDSSLHQYNEYITEFEVLNEATGETYIISNDKSEKLYISYELNNIIRKKGEPVDGKISIDFNEIKEVSLFLVKIENNDLTKTLAHLNRLLNKSSIIKDLTKDEWMQQIVETAIAGDLNISAIHLEVIMSSQIRDIDDVLYRPQWECENEPYEILTLNKALTYNPSITISLSYQKIAKLLYNPITFRKKDASFIDLFFMECPQLYTHNLEKDESNKLYDEDGLIIPIVEIDDTATKSTKESALEILGDFDTEETEK